MEREDYYTALEGLYSRLDAALPTFEGNACGTCNLCCTARGLTSHVVSDLELDYLRARVGPARVEAFRRFALREEGEVCPYYEGGCTVYAHRPYSCRTFGHYRERSTLLPEVCVFNGHERQFETRAYFTEVPEAGAIHQLKRDYLVLREPAPVTARAGPAPTKLDHLNPDDPLDRAWMQLLQGDFVAAEGSALEAPESPTRQRSLGLARSGQENWEGAWDAFARAVQLAPRAADLRYQLARAMLELGALDPAAAELDEAVRLNPQHAPALAYRGYVEIARGNLAAAPPWLKRSLEVDPEQPLVQQRLQAVQQRLA